MQSHTVSHAYARFAPLYDFFFGHVLAPGRRAAIDCLQLPAGGRVLEVGIGTGLSLPLYPHSVKVSGIDLSPEMLARARLRVERRRLAHVEELRAMDAQALEYADHSFDAVIAMYVVSVAPDPLRVVREMRRVCRPTGELVIVNHFHTNSRAIRALERYILKPLHRRVHFRSDLDLKQFTRDSGLKVEDAFRANILGYSTVLRCRNDG